jgi:hypothetical protein
MVEIFDTNIKIIKINNELLSFIHKKGHTRLQITNILTVFVGK